MNTYQKILTVSVVVLVILNVSLLAMVWQKRSARDKRFKKEPNRFKTEQLIQKRLNLDSDQKEAFTKLQKAHQKKLRALGRETRLLNRELHRAIVNDQPEVEANISEKMDSLHQLMKQENFDHIRSLSQICRPDQREKLLKVLDDLPDRMGHRGHKKMKHMGRD